VIVFIVVPNNRSLANYVDVALSYLSNPAKDRIIKSRGEDIPFIVEELSKNGKKVIGLTGKDLLREYELFEYNTKLVVLKNAGHFSFLDQPEKFVKELIEFI